MNKIMVKIFAMCILCSSLTSCGTTSNQEDTTSDATEELIEEFEPEKIKPSLLNQNEISFGLYPQSVVLDENIISTLNSSNPTYKDYYLINNQYYIKNQNGLEFETESGQVVTAGVQYYKLEPIVWNILSNSDNTFILISKYVLDSHRYNQHYFGEKNGVYCSNYEKSEIRQWLNNDFINNAFLDDSYLKKIEVDNSLASTMKEENEYVCSNTNDFAFLPSVKDLTNPAYGFEKYDDGYSADPARITERTEYFASKTNTEMTSLVGLAPYWTRTPYGKNLETHGVDYTGASVLFCNSENGRIDAPSSVDLGGSSFYYSLGGVRPCICISMDVGAQGDIVAKNEQTISYPTSNVTVDDIADIMARALYIEKKYMHHATMGAIIPETGEYAIDMKRYRNDYSYENYIFCQFYYFSKDNYHENYVRQYLNGTMGEITGGTFDENGNYTDPYSYFYGYAQFGFAPAAYVACQNGLYLTTQEFNPTDISVETIQGKYVLMFKGGISKKMWYRMVINSYGGLDVLQWFEEDTDVSQVTDIESGFISHFGLKQTAPQSIVDLF